MYQSHRYARQTVVEIDAAVIGTSQDDWLSLPKGSSKQEDARALMETHQFDVFPMLGGSELNYYHTTTWGNFSEVKLARVEYADTIPLTMLVREVIQQLATTERNFLFLTDEYRVTGLLTIADLNCRQVRTYLFSLLSDLELRFGALLQAHITSDGSSGTELLNLELKPAQKQQFEEDTAKGVARALVEYLYLPDFLKAIKALSLTETIGYSSNTQFDKAMNPLIELRNQVAHPAKSLIDGPAAVAKLWEKVELIERVLFRLRMKS